MANTTPKPPQANPRISRVKIVAIVIVAAALLVSLFQVASNSQFRLAAISPESGTFPTSTDTIIADFSRHLKPVDEQPEGAISLQPALAHTASINERTLTIELLELPEKDSDLSVIFNGLVATDDATLTTTVSYRVSYVPFNQLSPEEQAKQAAGVGTPASRHPLLSKLPHSNVSYDVSYVPNAETFGTAATWQEEKDNFVVVVTTFAFRADDMSNEEYAQKHVLVRELAVEWIQRQGVDPDNDIVLTFSPEDEILGLQPPSVTVEDEPNSEDFIISDQPTPSIDTPQAPPEVNVEDF